jgi:hypothetical protein
MLQAFQDATATSRASVARDEPGQNFALRAVRFFLDAQARHLHARGGVAPWHTIVRGNEVCRGG